MGVQDLAKAVTLHSSYFSPRLFDRQVPKNLDGLISDQSNLVLSSVYCFA